MVVHKSATSFQKPQTITVNLEQQLVSTNNSSQKVDLSSSTTASKREIGGNHMKNDPIHWRRTKYGRNRQNNNKNKLLYALIQLHNHYIHVISFLNKMMTLPTFNQQQQLEHGKTKQ